MLSETKPILYNNPSPMQRYSSRVWNLNSGDNWGDMCARTSAVINGFEHSKPMNCVDKVREYQARLTRSRTE